MQVNLTFAPGTTLQQMISFETAGRLWASHLTDNAAINIHVEPSSILPVGVAGGALLGVQPDQSYNTWRNRLSADRKTTDDQTVHQNLPSNLTSFTASVDGVSQTSSTINLSRANAKALGMRGTQNSGLDGYILMNNQLSTLGLSWNYNLGTIPANTVDFLSVAVHEIGHVLGFYSGVDASGWLLDGITGFEEDEEEDEEDFDQDPRGSLRNATSLDMFRFSDRGTINLSQGGTPYFSLNSGRTQLGLFSTGTGPDGDGFQASHWKSRSTPFEIMEPDIDLAQRRRIINLDRRAMDVIGWDLGTSSVTLSSLQTQARQSL
nr:NF038122 family metalloprotease [Elainella sp. Prado103]